MICIGNNKYKYLRLYNDNYSRSVCRVGILCLLFTLLCSGCTGHRHEMTDEELWVRISEGDTIDCYIRYKDHIYSKEGSLPLEKREPIYAIDAATFRVCKGTGYAIDRYRVYYPLKPKYLYVEDDDLGKSVPYALQWVVESGNTDKFAYLGDGYAIAGDRMFINGEPTVWRESIIKKYQPRYCPAPDPSDVKKKGFNGDVGIWEKLGENEQKGNFVRLNGEIFVLRVESGINDRADAELNYAEFLHDIRNGEIRRQTKLHGVDIETFRVCKGSGYAKDKNHIYNPEDWIRLKTPGIEGLDIYAAKEIAIEEADVPSFRYIGDGFAIDKSNMYSDGTIVDIDTLLINTAMRLHSTNLLFRVEFPK